MNNMRKIILFLVYCGKLPNFFGLWLKAVENNPTIDFCVISDCDFSSFKLPINVQLVQMSFKDLRDKIQSKFDFKISLKNYGRLSQFRPALAYIFPEKVKGYDYWGYIECDLIPGNIRKFLTDDVLERHDKIFYLGHFQVFKNNETMNTLFMRRYKRALDYKFAFKHEVLFFEERLGMQNIAEGAGCKTFSEPIYADLQTSEYLFKLSRHLLNKTNQAKSQELIFSYNDGTLCQHSIDGKGRVIMKEIIYLHLQKRMMGITTTNTNKYLVVPNSFVEYEDITKSSFEKMKNDAKDKTEQYRAMMLQKSKSFRRSKYMKLCSWILLFKRIGIRRAGGYDY